MQTETPKRLKELTSFRLDRELKAAGQISASKQNRSFSNYLENLVKHDVVKEGLYPPKDARKD